MSVDTGSYDETNNNNLLSKNLQVDVNDVWDKHLHYPKIDTKLKNKSNKTDQIYAISSHKFEELERKKIELEIREKEIKLQRQAERDIKKVEKEKARIEREKKREERLLKNKLLEEERLKKREQREEGQRKKQKENAKPKIRKELEKLTAPNKKRGALPKKRCQRPVIDSDSD